MTLLARAGCGEDAALRLLIARKLSRIHSLAWRMLGDRGHADDVAQETFLRIWRQARTWQPGAAQFDTWLHRVVLNLCLDHLRKRREVPMAKPPEQVDPAPAADRALKRHDTMRGVRDALASLPLRQRDAIVLHTYQNLSNIETAAIMGIGVEALESLLSRARRALRSRLAEVEP